MKDKIESIRGLLNDIESKIGDSDDKLFVHNFNALELPGIVSDIVDFLVPALQPYEASFYFYLFRHSILSSGQQYCRVSTTALTKGVVISSAAQRGESLGLNTVRATLRGLEEKGVIVKHGEPNQQGTPYKVLLPEEIDMCQKLKEQSSSRELPKPVDEERELDFYNVAENRLKIFERDNYQCHYCKKQLTRFTVTLDHIQPVSQGGDNSYNNLITACLHCNSERGNRPIMDFVVKKDESNA
jgi:Fe2+ or Zn2+ uptake regulation protein